MVRPSKSKGSAWDELKHIRQAVGFLVVHQKSRISYDEITNDLCPVISSMNGEDFVRIASS